MLPVTGQTNVVEPDRVHPPSRLAITSSFGVLSTADTWESVFRTRVFSEGGFISGCGAAVEGGFISLGLTVGILLGCGLKCAATLILRSTQI